MSYKRLIIVSNRLPYKPVSRKKGVEFLPSSGGLVSSIKSYIDKTRLESKPDSFYETCWIGSLDSAETNLLSGKKWTQDNFTLEPVELAPEVYSRFYNGFCNSTIWPLFHYFPSYATFSNDDYESFVAVNKIFAEKIKAIYRPGDFIWVHDYHLMLLPELIRKEIPEATIGFFLHIPFPSFEIFRLLPGRWRKEILQGLLGSDLIGFHTNDYLQYFSKSVRQILGCECQMRTITTPDRSVIVDTFPVSIDFAKFNSASADPEIFAERNNIKRSLGEKKIVISVDRLDYSKGIINRLEGFETFLETNPAYIGKITYTIVIVPSRDVIPKYTKNKKTIEELISKINGRYGSIGWTPIIYQYKNLDHKQLSALYLSADAALIAPVRDGMNLVAKEFVASRIDKKGVLILSETAGAAAELGEALIVNPTDRTEIAEAILKAIEMHPDMQMERMEIMQKRIKNYDVVKWAEDFISQLMLYKKLQQKFKVKVLTENSESDIMQRYAAAEKRLLLLDYDGTLVPLRSLPHQAVPSAQLLELLNNLSENKKNKVVIISGRPADVLQHWFGKLNIDLVAEHGAFIKTIGADWRQTSDSDTGWKSSVLPVFNMFCERCAGSFIEEKRMSLAWHYRNAEQELGFTRSRELINSLYEISSDSGFQILEGKKVVEARAWGIDKGTAAQNWISEYREGFILAAGDDKTDEDLFRAIPFGGFTIRIGLDQSIARFNCKSHDDFMKVLRKLANISEAAALSN